MSAPVVDLRIWRVERLAPALLRMATGRRRLRGVPGLRFAKLLGTGSGRTFTPRDADPEHWGLLTVWDGARAADSFGDHSVARGWEDASVERLRVRLDAGPTAEDAACTPRGPEVRAILDREFGVLYSLPAVYVLLHRLGYSCLDPRPRHRKADPEAREGFKKKSTA